MKRQKNHKTRLKLAMAGTLPPIRGLSAYCLELSLALARLIQVHFISFRKIYPSFLYPGGGLKDDTSFPETGLETISVSRKITWFNPLAWLREGLLTKADILHIQWWTLPLFPVYFTLAASFRLRGIPVVITIHNAISHEDSRLFGFFSGLLFNLGDHFIVHTKKNFTQMRNHYLIPGSKLSLIPHGTLDFFKLGKGSRTDARASLGLGDNEKAVLVFGAIRPYKGIDTALEALALVRRKIPEIRLIIAGKLWRDWSPYEEIIRKFKLDAIVTRHLDYIPSGEVWKFFTAADLVLLPYNNFDSQSGVGAAALAFRKPLIVSRVGGLPDLVEDKRFAVPPKNATALAESIIKSLKTPGCLESMEASSARIAEIFSWNHIASETIGVYEKVLNECRESHSTSN